MTLQQAKRSFSYFDPFTKRQERVEAGRTWADPASVAFQADPTAFQGSVVRSTTISRRAGARSSVSTPVPARREFVVTFASRSLYEGVADELEPGDLDGERACWAFGTVADGVITIRDFLSEAWYVNRSERHIDANPVRALRYGSPWRLIAHMHSHPRGTSRASDEDKAAWAAWLGITEGPVFASVIWAQEREGQARRPGPYSYVTKREGGRVTTSRATLQIPRPGEG